MKNFILSTIAALTVSYASQAQSGNPHDNSSDKILNISANNAYTETGVEVHTGDTVYMNATGEYECGTAINFWNRGHTVGPEGYPPNVSRRFATYNKYANEPNVRATDHAALVILLLDNNNEIVGGCEYRNLPNSDRYGYDKMNIVKGNGHMVVDINDNDQKNNVGHVNATISLHLKQ